MGFWELTVILVVALIVIGPKRLPGIARTLGRYIGKAKSLHQHVRAEIDHEIKLDNLNQNRLRAKEAEDSGKSADSRE